MKKIVLTGGGTAGHVTPNLSLLPYLREAQFEIHYIGSRNGIEKEIISKETDVTYHAIRTGKLRRYFSWKNFTDPFRVIAGYGDAKKCMKEIKPDVVFSKGGFVSVPVAAAAHKYQIPVISHESDITPGLANRIAKRFATKICLTFPDGLQQIPPPLGVYTGSPIRESLYQGDAERARRRLSFDRKPVILVMGGSLGSKVINQALRANLESLCSQYNIIHLCGKKNLVTLPESASDFVRRSYAQFEFVSEELSDFLACADLIVSRAGSNAIHEFLALHKPMLLIPLSLEASRGDQILNAESFEKRGFAIVLREENLTPESFRHGIDYLAREQIAIRAAMSKENELHGNGTAKIMEMIQSVL